MTNVELLAHLQTPEFDIQDYQPLVNDTLQQNQEKITFLTQVASLAEDQSLDLPEPISCMVNCVIAYLACCNGQGGNSSCWLLLNNCLGNCGGQD